MLSCPSLTHIIYLFIEIKSPFSRSFNHAAVQHYTMQHHKDIFHMCSAKWGAEIAVPIFKLNCALCAGTQWWQYITFQTCYPHLPVTPLYRLMSIVFYQFEASSIIDIDSFRDKQRYTIDRRMAFVALASAWHLRNIMKEKGNVILRYLPTKLSCLQHIFPGILEIETRECFFYLQPAARRRCGGWD